MQVFWFRIAQPILYSALISFILTLFTNYGTGLICFIGLLLITMAYRARQISKLTQWLKKPLVSDIPDGDGVWDDIFSMLYKMTKKHNATKQELASELSYMRQLTEALPEGITILNKYNRIEWCNLPAQHHFGLDTSRDIQQDITYLVRQPDFVAYLHGKDFSKQLIMHPARREELALSIRIIPYGEEKQLLCSTDITQLEKMENMRRSFVADVSHELRTPLTVVNGYVENLLDMPDLPAEQIHIALQQISEQTQRMETLVKDLLSLSGLQSAPTPARLSTINMVDLLKDVLHDAQKANVQQHQIKLNIETEQTLLANKNEIRLAFINLINNAIRYTPEGGEIKIFWYQKQSHLIFAVQDSGIGIPKAAIPRITERFYRVEDSRSRETGGTGLGLSIVETIVQRHQARLHIQSQLGKGSSFSIIFSNQQVK